MVIDAGMLEICKVVAGVKGWSMQQTAERMLTNFRQFYAGQIS